MYNFEPENGTALIVVDLQRDFLSDGSFAVPDGNKIINVVNRYVVSLFLDANCTVFATRDWHPPDHCSFLNQGGPWPPHCIGGTDGAEFAQGFEVPNNVVVIDKGVNQEHDAYSGFDGTDLNDRLQSLGVNQVFVCGLATEYCVYHTIIDALAYGYRVVLLKDAVAAIDQQPGDGGKAMDEMKRRGARIMTIEEFLR